MIILHFHLQPQFKYELFHIYFTISIVHNCLKICYKFEFVKSIQISSTLKNLEYQ